MKIVLPNSFEDLTIAQFTELNACKDEHARLLLLCPTLTTKTLRKVSQKALRKAYAHIETLLDAPLSTHVVRITIKDEEYGFIPDWDSFTFGEYIDMTEYCKDVHANATKIMALTYRKIKRERNGQYWIEDYTSTEDHKEFGNLPAPLLGGVLSFFLTSRNRLLKDTKLSLAKILKEVSLGKDGVGIQPSTPYLAKAFSKWMKLRKSLSGLFSRTSATYKT